ncbi:IucA/IucC family protein [Kineosporia sp. NBRC 101731]|uniref:IucA/IucC family protein n=1 Tax=Kineosporia sp. NBRC 101731 TaxID=3032199 RepID=UPI0024A59373|nr:IucA/IucC family protein [Kineosporia sp. NBRC 101731]GLY26952.1 iron transporter [Kineosporia sp. NBRC 101731]
MTLTGSSCEVVTRDEASAEAVTVVALLNCLVREVSAPGGNVVPDGADRVVITLEKTGQALSARLYRPMMNVSRGTLQPRFTGEVENNGIRLGWRELLVLVDAELTAITGETAGHLLRQIEASHQLIADALQHRKNQQFSPDVYLDLEQSLLAGHRYHPAPKARSGPADEVRQYAPELGARFQLRHLAVRSELVREIHLPGAPPDSDAAPAGYRRLPLHPWQYAILLRGDELPAALADGRAIDLGPSGPWMRPTSSVRTVAADDSEFVKLSLSVLITNCLRINPWHEVQAAVTLAGLLEPLRRELATRFPGTVMLRETSGLTADLGPGTTDQLGVIRREGLAGRLRPDVLAVPSAALAEPLPHPVVRQLLDRLAGDRARLLDWWQHYLGLLLPPVLHAYARHGVVFEAHLQNVVIGLDGDGQPVQLVLRDLEGVKLVRELRGEDLAAMPEPVRAHVGTPRNRGWDRVGYCLLANHVGGLISALADRAPDAEPALWAAVHDQLAEVEPFDELQAVLAGEPVPVKTNLLTRWRSAADRDSGYVPLYLPLGPVP